MDKEQIIKRLSIVKLLYKIGVEQSKQSETTSFFSILSFHDSIEMFLKLAAELKNVKSDALSFLEYWDKIPDLTLKESMRSLNTRRVNLKHKGLIPAKVEIETSRVNTTDFFEQNTPIVFSLRFDEVSLYDLLKFEKTKTFLKNSQSSLDSDKMEACVVDATKAFYELLYDYKETKVHWGYKTHFDFIEKIRWSSYNSSNKLNGGTDKEVEKAIQQINKNFDSIDNALEVISLGLDYRKYTKFKILTPYTHRFSSDNYHMQITGEKNWSKENCQFLIDFVLESGLKLQEFDFDYEKLDITRPTITFK